MSNGDGFKIDTNSEFVETPSPAAGGDSAAPAGGADELLPVSPGAGSVVDTAVAEEAKAIAPTTLDFEGEDDHPEGRPVANSHTVVKEVQPQISIEADSDIGATPTQSMEDDDDDLDEVIHRRHQLQEDTFKRGSAPGPALALPTMSIEDIGQLVTIASTMAAQLTDDQRTAVMTHGSSIGLHHTDEVFQRFFDNPKARLVQVLRAADKTPLAQTTPSFKEPKKGAILDLAEASAYAASLSRAFDHIYIIAHHSGMWLKVQVPQSTEIHNLLGRMTATRGDLGYSTRGNTLSADSALRNMTFVNFIVERTVQTNMADSSPEAIRRNLAALDIQLLAQQMASALHPSGHPVERACSTKPGVCSHVERDTLRLSKLQHIDADRFTDKQLAHMQTLLKKGHRKTEQDMASYRAEFGSTITRRYEIEDSIWVTYQFPMVDVYEDTAEEWAASTKRESEEILNLMTVEEGRRHLEQQANLTVMTKYAAWVTEIEMNGRFVQDRMAIKQTLGQLSGNNKTVEKFSSGVTAYITDCTVAAVGVADYSCPVCNGRQADGQSGLLKSIAPIDAVTAFFTLAQLKIQHTLSRDSGN